MGNEQSKRDTEIQALSEEIQALSIREATGQLSTDEHYYLNALREHLRFLQADAPPPPPSGPPPPGSNTTPVAPTATGINALFCNLGGVFGAPSQGAILSSPDQQQGYPGSSTQNINPNNNFPYPPPNSDPYYSQQPQQQPGYNPNPYSQHDSQAYHPPPPPLNFSQSAHSSAINPPNMNGSQYRLPSAQPMQLPSSSSSSSLPPPLPPLPGYSTAHHSTNIPPRPTSANMDPIIGTGRDSLSGYGTGRSSGNSSPAKEPYIDYSIYPPTPDPNGYHNSSQQQQVQQAAPAAALQLQQPQPVYVPPFKSSLPPPRPGSASGKYAESVRSETESNPELMPADQLKAYLKRKSRQGTSGVVVGGSSGSGAAGAGGGAKLTVQTSFRSVRSNNSNNSQTEAAPFGASLAQASMDSSKTTESMRIARGPFAGMTTGGTFTSTASYPVEGIIEDSSAYNWAKKDITLNAGPKGGLGLVLGIHKSASNQGRPVCRFIVYSLRKIGGKDGPWKDKLKVGDIIQSIDGRCYTDHDEMGRALLAARGFVVLNIARPH